MMLLQTWIRRMEAVLFKASQKHARSCLDLVFEAGRLTTSRSVLVRAKRSLTTPGGTSTEALDQGIVFV
jgi:hypothetical protein